MTLFIYLAVGALAFFAGLCAGAVSERKRAVQITSRIVSIAGEPDHEFWKGYAAAAAAAHLHIKGGAL